MRLSGANTGPLTWNVGAFYNRYDSFVFIAPTGALDAEEGVAVYAYQQRPADLYGFEGELGIPVAVARGDLAVKLMGDWLRGRLRDGGGNLPAITPWRTGVGLDYDLGPLHLGGDLTYHARQDDVAANELPTDAYTLLTADVSYRWTLAYGRLFAFLRGYQPPGRGRPPARVAAQGHPAAAGARGARGGAHGVLID